MTPGTSLSRARTDIRDGIDRGTAWLLSQQQPDGSMNGSDQGLSTYYKTPLALASRGEIEAVARLLQWIESDDQTDRGDFGWANGRGAMAFNATYPNAWITCGAHRAGIYVVSSPAIDHILTLQDAGSGGFYRVHPDTTPPAERTGKGVYAGGIAPGGQDALNTSMSGLACLATGHVQAAKRAGAFLHRMLEAQPAPNDHFYYQWRTDRGLITDLPENERVPFVIDADTEGQNYFQLGIAASFLARLHQVDRAGGHLNAARSYLDVLDTYAADRYSIGKAGKVGWGAAYVYRLTGEQKYLDIALEVGTALLNLQGESGAWVESRPINVQVEVTSEFVTLLSEMQEAFARS